MKRITPGFLFALALAVLLSGCQRAPPPEMAASTPPATAGDPTEQPAPAAPAVPAGIEKAPPRKQSATSPAKKPQPADRDSAGAGADVQQHDAERGDARDDYADGNDLPLEFPERGDDIDDDAPPPPAARPVAWRPHWDGLGDVTLGMDVDEVMDDFPGQFAPLSDSDRESCFYLEGRGGSAQPALMFEQGRFVRFDVDNPRMAAPGGGRVGMDADEIVDRYDGDVERVPHKYTDGEYLRVENPSGDSILLFETDEGGVVTEWRIGIEPAIDYVEGCS